MMSTKTEFPLLKEQLMKDFGYISFQLALANVDIIGIRIVKSYEVVIITFYKNRKTGFIYEGGNLTNDQVFQVFQDVPEDRNQLAVYEKSMEFKTILMKIVKWTNLKEKNKKVDLNIGEEADLVSHLGRKKATDLIEKINRELSGDTSAIGKVEVLHPPKRNYVFVTDREVKEIRKKK